MVVNIVFFVIIYQIFLLNGYVRTYWNRGGIDIDASAGIAFMSPLMFLIGIALFIMFFFVGMEWWGVLLLFGGYSLVGGVFNAIVIKMFGFQKLTTCLYFLDLLAIGTFISFIFYNFS